MNKVFAITLGLIFLVGVVGAVSFGIDDKFDKKVKKIKHYPLCEAEDKMKVKEKKCKGDEVDPDVPDEVYVYENKDGVIKID